MNALPNLQGSDNINRRIAELLLQLKTVTDVEYPRYLLDPRKAEYLSQVTTVKTAAPSAKGTAGIGSNGNMRNADQ